MDIYVSVSDFATRAKDSYSLKYTTKQQIIYTEFVLFDFGGV